MLRYQRLRSLVSTQTHRSTVHARAARSSPSTYKPIMCPSRYSCLRLLHQGDSTAAVTPATIEIVPYMYM